MNCPTCHKPVKLTRHGRIPRHGQRSYARNQRTLSDRRGYPMVQTRGACGGSGEKPVQNERTLRIAQERARMFRESGPPDYGQRHLSFLLALMDTQPEVFK